MRIAMVWNCLVILLGFVLFDICFSRVINRSKALLACYYCEEHYFGSCGGGYNMKISICLGTDKSCFYKSYYDPFNNGHGGRYTYERGCTTCDNEECLANATLFGIGLKEYLEILECYDCEQIYNGHCAAGIDLEKTFCFETAVSCYSMVFYNPFNDGYGGKYKYRRGCTMFSETKDFVNFTSIGFSLLEEYIGPTLLCNTSLCNNDPMKSFIVEDPLGIKL